MHRHSSSPLGPMLLQLNSLMLLIAHHSMCVCVCVCVCARVRLSIYACNTQTHTHTDSAVDRLYRTLLCHKKIEIAPGSYDANLLRGKKKKRSSYLKLAR